MLCEYSAFLKPSMECTCFCWFGCRVVDFMLNRVELICCCWVTLCVQIGSIPCCFLFVSDLSFSLAYYSWIRGMPPGQFDVVLKSSFMNCSVFFVVAAMICALR